MLSDDPMNKRPADDKEAKGKPAGAEDNNPTLEEGAARLAQKQKVAAAGEGDPSVLRLMDALEDALQAVYDAFRDIADANLVLTYSAEWYLDNFYLLQRAHRLLEKGLPRRYYDELPTLVDAGRDQGFPRIYALARAIVVDAGFRLEIDAIRRYVMAYQREQPLTVGELWALPLFLRLVLLQGIVQAASTIVEITIDQIFTAPPLAIATDAPTDDIIPAAIPSLLQLADTDWDVFFERVSLVEEALRRDPAGVYARMTFGTRNRYRKAVEELAAGSDVSELGIAQAAVRLAQAALPAGAADVVADASTWEGLALPRQAHVGYYLVGDGHGRLTRELDYAPDARTRLLQAGYQHATFFYLGSILATATLLVLALIWYVLRTGSMGWEVGLTFLLGIVPAITAAVSFVNWVVIQLVPPRVLPKLDFSKGIAPRCKTMVVVPSMLGSFEEVRSLLQQLELHYLRNPDSSLRFALLTDFVDAETEKRPEDDALLAAAVEGIARLNAQHSASPFYLFHRRRLWNPAEGKWMGWERKRGKLHEFNRLIAGDDDTSFSAIEGERAWLADVRYVITLDADTILPRASARRLVGTIAHPLNRAVFDDKSGKVVAGYTILQPRTEIKPTSATQSLFTRVFSGDAGLDLYTLAVSDVYQDLFGEGSYVGKGIYDVAAFERSLAGRVPENALLSHDLFEGIHGRAGLVTDIVLYEDYPAHYFLHMRRSHRWIRGDWQLLPWLFPVVPGAEGRRPNDLSAIDWWKLFDNLRRSLVAPALVLLLLAGWTTLPGAPWIWTLVGLSPPAVSLLTGLLVAVARGVGGASWDEVQRPVRDNGVRWLLFLAFLPYEAVLNVDAIVTTLVRVYWTQRHLLRWTTAAHAARTLDVVTEPERTWQQMVSSLVVALSAGLLVYLIRPAALIVAAPLLLAWLLSPQIAYWISRPEEPTRETIDAEARRKLRALARRTWYFFEQFTGPEDNWLPPDHFQEQPKGVVAHRTSPTNIGLYLGSTLAAYHLGYVSALDLILRLRPTFETMARLERYRGHFLNWLDTRSLSPLPPRYVSTVDSGNLAAMLLALRQGCLHLGDEPLLRWERWQGLLDSLEIMEEAVLEAKANGAGASERLQELSRYLESLQEQIRAAADEHRRWPALLRDLRESISEELDRRVVALLEEGAAVASASTLRSWRLHADGIYMQLSSMSRELALLAPWLTRLDDPPELLATAVAEGMGEIAAAWDDLRTLLWENSSLRAVVGRRPAFEDALDALRAAVAASEAPEAAASEVNAWCSLVAEDVQSGRMAVEALLIGFEAVARDAESFFEAMDFGFLYDGQRHVFHIGYNVDAGQLDDNYYDLLASEARITSLLAIAKGDVPQRHWLYLARPITEIDHDRTLLSWSGTMFEYLMPPLLLRRYPETLLNSSEDGAIVAQIRYAARREIPWGISESGFYTFDSAMNYQYRAFGVPDLGFKRGLGEDLVVTPYATMLALPYRPRAVVANVEQLRRQGMVAGFGFYEAIDFTPARLDRGHKFAIVRSFMAHHQGMILLALLNFLQDERMVAHFHSDPRIQSVELLLQEQVPYQSPLEYPGEEEVEPLQRPEMSVAVHPWDVPVETPSPLVNFLSNGDYRVLLTNAGGGYSHWGDVALTRWRADSTRDHWGQWLYVEDETGGHVWSAASQPLAGQDNGQAAVQFAPHTVEFRKHVFDTVLHLEVTVPPGHAVEVRRARITNDSEETRQLRLTSYAEVVLTDQASDVRHPAFAKLFVESEYVPEQNALLYWRHRRDPDEEPVYMAHMLVLADDRPLTRAHETDRARFLGRNRTAGEPAALGSGAWLTGTTGATLDPIMSLGQRLELEARSTAELAWVTVAGHSRAAVLAELNHFSQWGNVTRAFIDAEAEAGRRLRQHEFDVAHVQQVQKLLSPLLYPYHALRANTEVLSSNERGQPALWSFGISGDYPLMLLQLSDETEMSLLQEVLRAHGYWRTLGLQIDLVILNQRESSYDQELQGLIHRVIREEDGESWLNRRGGIFVLRQDQMDVKDRDLLFAAARVVLSGAQGDLATGLQQLMTMPVWLPAFTSTGALAEADEAVAPVAPVEGLLFDNGYGGFTADGREYVIYRPAETPTPAPWINVIANNPSFGFYTSESGGGYTWALNSGENRLTVWHNDPVSDLPVEALYLRDEETGDVWSSMPQPAPADEPYLVRHGAGYSTFEHNSHGLRQQLRVFADTEAPLKVLALTLENTLPRPRRLTATFYAHWILGTEPEKAQYIVPEYVEDQRALLARNPYAEEFGERAAFAASLRELHGLTTDRTEFLGRLGSPRMPAALQRIGLENRVQAGRDSCAALQVHLDLASRGKETVYFLLGQEANRDDALALLDRFGDAGVVEEAWRKVNSYWDEILGAVQVETPEPAMNLLLNRWLLYQALSCRIWGRSALYQSSGAYGFRDQLQDVMSVVFSRPDVARRQILRAARHQFEAGDVLHWWHPPSGRGVRTRIRDDLLWLPFVTAHYVTATGDRDVLDEKVPFLSGAPLAEDEEERYGRFEATTDTFSVLEHCRRALRRGTTAGRHGLPLIGAGDWNDGMNRVGAQGKGESVWLAWFLYATLMRFADLCTMIGEEDEAAAYRQQAHTLQEAIAATSWDGQWYLRAFYDDGTPLGSSTNEECRIDAIAQSWGVISGAAEKQRAAEAMRSVESYLIKRDDRLLLLFTPPFAKTPRDPGYIKGYLPGIRENGGQYTHAALWTIWAYAEMGEGKKAEALYHLINPVLRASTRAEADHYKVEPYVVSADVYGVPPHVGEGGWTWYTGSAGWMYRLGVERILGVFREGERLRLDPRIPPSWSGYEVTLRHGASCYHVTVENKGNASKISALALDGEELEGNEIPLRDDGAEHDVHVTLA